MTLHLRSFCLWAVCVTLLTAGCTRSQPSNRPESSAKQKADVSLASPLASLQPDEFELNVPRYLPSAEINRWAEEMMADPAEGGVSDEKLAQALKSVLSDNEINRVMQRSFVERDSAYLRDCYWARAVTQLVAYSATDDVDRVSRLFYQVVDNLVVGKASTVSIPMGPFEALLVGRGPAEMRAWTLSLLLRQHRIPTVLLDLGKVESATSSQPVLVGAVVGADVFVFDAQLGLPLSGAKDDATKERRPMMPATLKELQADDSLLRRFDVNDDERYPVTAEKLKSAKLRLIGETSVWARRMEGLQAGLTADRQAVVFESLVSVDAIEGVMDGLQAVARDHGLTEPVGVWDYPEVQREARESLTDEQKAAFTKVGEAFAAPRPLSVDVAADQTSVKLNFGSGWNHHRTARVQQLLGNYSEAIPMYLKLQGWRRVPPTPKGAMPITPASEPTVIEMLRTQTPDVVAMHEKAGSEALYWRGCCQISRGEYQVAASDLESYLQQVVYGSFEGPARYMAGVAAAMNGKLSRGSGFLRRIPKDDPQYFAARFLIRRWQE